MMKLFPESGGYRQGKPVVETFAILIANDPDDAESILRQFHFIYCKETGKEDCFLVYNLTLKDAQSLARRFRQQSFVFGKNSAHGLIFELWVNRSKNGDAYSKSDEKEISEDEANAEDCYTQLSGEFKFSVPLDRLQFNDDEMTERYYSRWFTDKCYRENFNANLEMSLDETYTFMGRAGARCRLDCTGKAEI